MCIHIQKLTGKLIRIYHCKHSRGRRYPDLHVTPKTCSGFKVMAPETMYISSYIYSLIAYSVESKMRSEAEENIPSSAVTTNANATLNGTTSSILVQQEPLAKRIAKHYPVANVIIAIFDTLGLSIFLCGFLYFLKDIIVYICVHERHAPKTDSTAPKTDSTPPSNAFRPYIEMSKRERPRRVLV